MNRGNLTPEQSSTRVVDPYPVLGPCPCDLCPSAARCKALLMCCGEFISFVDADGRWRTGVPRQPNRARYVYMYGDAPDDESIDDEREMVTATIAAAGSVPKAAMVLGMETKAVYKRLRRWRVPIGALNAELERRRMEADA